MKKSINFFFIPFFLVLLSTFVFYKNILQTAPNDLFCNFQWDSEGLVIGKILADINKKEVPNNANLSGSSISPRGRNQFFYVTENKPLENLSVKVNIALNGSLETEKNKKLDQYVGRKVLLPDGSVSQIGRIESDRDLTYIWLIDTDVIKNSPYNNIIIEISGEPFDPQTINYGSYISQYGIQGPLFSKLYKIFGSIEALYFFNSIMLALVIFALSIFYKKLVSNQFSFIFYLSMICSPWIVCFAKNLYWAPFTWFLPAVAVSFYQFSVNNNKKIIYFLLIYFCFILKCFIGYEYISSVILFAAAGFVLDFFSPERKNSRKSLVRDFLLVCLLGTLAFFTVLLVHAGTMRGDTILEGIQNIYEMDIKRRTYGDPNLFGKIHAASLQISLLDVLYGYIFSWGTDFLKLSPQVGLISVILSGRIFYLFILISVIIVIYRILSGHKQSQRDLGLLIAFAPVPLSWFVLAKAHTAIHTHMNYVLWYFGFAAALLHIFINGLRIGFYYTYQALKKLGKITEPTEPGSI